MSGLAAVPVEPFTFLRQLRAAEEELLCDEAYDQREEEGEDPVPQHLRRRTFTQGGPVGDPDADDDIAAAFSLARERPWVYGDGHYPHNPSPFAKCVDGRSLPPEERERVAALMAQHRARPRGDPGPFSQQWMSWRQQPFFQARLAAGRGGNRTHVDPEEDAFWARRCAEQGAGGPVGAAADARAPRQGKRLRAADAVSHFTDAGSRAAPGVRGADEPAAADGAGGGVMHGAAGASARKEVAARRAEAARSREAQDCLARGFMLAMGARAGDTATPAGNASASRAGAARRGVAGGGGSAGGRSGNGTYWDEVLARGLRRAAEMEEARAHRARAEEAWRGVEDAGLEGLRRAPAAGEWGQDVEMAGEEEEEEGGEEEEREEEGEAMEEEEEREREAQEEEGESERELAAWQQRQWTAAMAQRGEVDERTDGAPAPLGEGRWHADAEIQTEFPEFFDAAGGGGLVWEANAGERSAALLWLHAEGEGRGAAGWLALGPSLMIEWCELVLPNAPLVPLPGGAPGDRTRAWFDSEALPPVERAVLGGAPFDPRATATPAALASLERSVVYVLAKIDRIVERGTPPARIFLAGFGQGGALALAAAAAAPHALGGVACVAGWFPPAAPGALTAPAAHLSEVPVLVMHGANDTELPPVLANFTAARAEARGFANVTVVISEDANHSLGAEQVEELHAFIVGLAPKQPGAVPYIPRVAPSPGPAPRSAPPKSSDQRSGRAPRITCECGGSTSGWTTPSRAARPAARCPPGEGRRPPRSCPSPHSAAPSPESPGGGPRLRRAPRIACWARLRPGPPRGERGRPPRAG